MLVHLGTKMEVISVLICFLGNQFHFLTYPLFQEIFLHLIVIRIMKRIYQLIKILFHSLKLTHKEMPMQLPSQMIIQIPSMMMVQLFLEVDLVEAHHKMLEVTPSVNKMEIDL